jgi:hypothetical protein
MTKNADTDSLPLARKSYEDAAREHFKSYKTVSPEEFAKHHAQDKWVFNFCEYRYADREFNDWVHRLGDILHKHEKEPT